MTLSGTITAAALQTDFDAVRSLLEVSDRQDVDFVVPLRLASLAVADDVSVRSIAFTPRDDFEVRVLSLRVTDSGGAGRTVTAALAVENGDTSYLLDKTISTSVVTTAGTQDSRLDLRTVTGDRIRLVRGVRYRLTLTTSAGTVTGPLISCLLLRSVPKGADKFVSTVPNAFATGENLDGDKLNDNLRALSDDVNDAMERRQCRSFGIVTFDGVTQASDAVLRAFPVRLYGAADNLVIEGFELVLYSTVSVDWTATVSGSASVTPPTVTLAGAGATTEAYKQIQQPFSVNSDSADALLTLATAGTSTITRGYLVIHYSYDRTASVTRVTPEVFHANDLTVALLNAAISAASVGAAADAAALSRAHELFVVRTLGATSVAFQVPSGDRQHIRVQGWAIGPAAHTARITIGSTTLDINTTGSTTRVYGESVTTGTVTNDPTDQSDDVIVTIARQAGASNLDAVYVVVTYNPL